MISRRRFLAASAAGLTTLGGAAGIAGWRFGASEPRVDRYRIALPLPAGFDGFRLLLVSDVHAGPYMPASRMASVAHMLRSLEADLVLFAGDMVDARATSSDMRDFAESFADVRGRHGALSVPGNHEHLAGFETAAREIRGVGIPLLCGEHRTIERSGDTITILGVDDPGGRTFDPPQDEAVSELAARVPTGTFSILLAHRPAAFDAAARLGIPLTLSGHTHGGQIGLPARDLTPVRLLTRYVRGHYERGGSQLVVSSGVGTVDLPLRLGVPPSVALITLEKV